MNLDILNNLKEELKIAFSLTIAKKILSDISIENEKYSDIKEAVNKCWKWVENNNISAIIAFFRKIFGTYH